MVHDPIFSPGALPVSTALTGDPSVDAIHTATENARLAEMMAAARIFATSDMVIASPYGMMSPGALRTLVESVGFRHQSYDDLELRRLMVYVDARQVQAGKRPYAIKETQRQSHAAPAAPVRIPQLPRSASNEWEVTELHNRVCIPGGVYTWRKGLIVKLAELGEVTLRSVVEQGVKLKAYPEEMPRRTCSTCDTSWPADLPNGASCPMCFLNERGEDTRLRAVAERLEAMVGWALAVGAPPLDGDGTWSGQPTPDPGKLEVPKTIAAPVVESVADPLAATTEGAAESEPVGGKKRAKKDG
jgi:hypothetical protein